MPSDGGVDNDMSLVCFLIRFQLCRMHGAQ